MAKDTVAKKMAQASDRGQASGKGGSPMPNVAEKMSQAGGHGQAQMASGHRPKKGDTFHCESCGMEIKVTADCKSQMAAHFECCGTEMQMR